MLIYSVTNTMLETRFYALKEQRKQLHARCEWFYVNGDKSDMFDEVSC